jgi:hypothetical protein
LPDAPLGATSSWRSAGEIAAGERQALGHDLKPWSDLTPQMRVATCMYQAHSRQAFNVGRVLAVPGLPDTYRAIFLVDEAGHWSVEEATTQLDP